MEAAQVLFAEEDQVLVGNGAHPASVARPAREGDETVLVRWESTKKEEEVAIGDVKKIDLDAKRQTRGKRREASGTFATELGELAELVDAEALTCVDEVALVGASADAFAVVARAGGAEAEVTHRRRCAMRG